MTTTTRASSEFEYRVLSVGRDADRSERRQQLPDEIVGVLDEVSEEMRG